MSIDSFFCPNCHIGALQVQKVTYTRVFKGRLIVVPNVSALVCDVCGDRVFDSEMLSRLSGLLGPNTRSIRPVIQRN